MQDRTVMAIDPGSSKLGLAVVRRDKDGKLHLVERSICPREEFSTQLEQTLGRQKVEMVIVGSGTRSRDIVTEIRSCVPSMSILVIDEKDTTMQARERYWEYNKRRGWRRFWPATLQVPPEPVDDFVAFILAERVLLHS